MDTVSAGPAQAQELAKMAHVAYYVLRLGSAPSARRKGWKRWTMWFFYKMLRFSQAHGEGRMRGQELGELSLCRKTARTPARVEQSRLTGRLQSQEGKRQRVKWWLCSEEPESPQEPSGRAEYGSGSNNGTRKPISLDPVDISPKLESLIYPSC